MITITALLRAKPGHEATLQATLLDVAAYAAANEPGTVGYFVCRSEQDPALFTTYERFADRTAMERHNNSAALARALVAIRPILAEPPAIHTGAELSALQR